jgi:hypothetical protein
MEWEKGVFVELILFGQGGNFKWRLFSSPFFLILLSNYSNFFKGTFSRKFFARLSL